MARKFCVLHCLQGTHWTDHGQSWIDILRKSAEEHWDVFISYKGEFPENIHEYHGVVITGSISSAYDDDPWIKKLCKLVRDCVSSEKGPKLLGGCFGHQLLAHALGGKVTKNPSGKCALRAEHIELSEKMTEQGYVKKALEQFKTSLPKVLVVLESHNDQVIEFSQDLGVKVNVWATSKTANIEIFAIGDRVLGVQCHPEMTTEDFKTKIFPKEKVTNQERQDCLKTFEQNPKLDHEFIHEVWRQFLHS